MLHRCVAQTTESCPTYKCVVSHISMSQAAPMPKSHHSNEGLPAWMKTPYHTCEFVTTDTWRSHVVHYLCMHTSFQEDYAHVFSRGLCTTWHVISSMWFQAYDFKCLEKRCACGHAKTRFPHQLKPHINRHTIHHATHMKKSRHTYKQVKPRVDLLKSPLATQFTIQTNCRSDFWEMSTTQNEEKKCVWACNDGYFLLEPNENRISQPMAIVLGAVGGVLLGLICK